MIELIIFIFILFGTTVPISCLLGKFISISFNDNSKKTKASSIFDKIEYPIFKLCGINPSIEFTPKKYFLSLFRSNIFLSILCFLFLYFQNQMPYKGNVAYQLDVSLILHILSSLITNTCQTHHIPELHLTHFSNFIVLPLLMFYSSASGIATGIMTVRAIILSKIGNPYADVVRALTRILLPGSFLLTIIFVACGMPNTFLPSLTYETLESAKQTIILGPIAAFEAIKLFGENGQSCFTANSSHPFENPSYLSNLIQLISILVLPIALIFTVGFWLKNKKQAQIIIFILLLVLSVEFALTTFFELKGNQQINNLINIQSSNWIGKETRLGIIGSSVFEATVSNVSGAANSSLEGFHPIVAALGLFNLSNQSIFGVQGFGLVFTINFILYTSFFIGLMLGKTPELFGKRIEKNEIILSAVLLLINPFLVLLGTITTLIFLPNNSTNIYEHTHYFTRVFYEFASGAASNGSGLEGLKDNTRYWNLSLATVMFIARYSAMAAMIFLGASLAKKPVLPPTPATFKTDTFLFGFIFLFMSVITTILTYLPFIILGPINELLARN